MRSIKAAGNKNAEEEEENDEKNVCHGGSGPAVTGTGQLWSGCYREQQGFGQRHSRRQWHSLRQ